MQPNIKKPLINAESIVDQLRQRMRFTRSARPADAAVLLAITCEPQPKVMLTRRASHMRHHAGEVSFPGGRREPGDTSNIVVALREAFEETALSPFDVELIGELPSQRAKSGIWVKPIVGLIAPDMALVGQPEEIERIFYADLFDLIHLNPLPYSVQLNRQQYFMPSYQMHDEVIWGLTARILVSLFRRGLKQPIEWPLLMNQPIDKSITQSIDQIINQAANQTINQTAQQSTSQPIIQPFTHTVKK